MGLVRTEEQVKCPLVEREIGELGADWLREIPPFSLRKGGELSWGEALSFNDQKSLNSLSSDGSI